MFNKKKKEHTLRELIREFYKGVNQNFFIRELIRTPENGVNQSSLYVRNL